MSDEVYSTGDAVRFDLVFSGGRFVARTVEKAADAHEAGIGNEEHSSTL